MGDGVIGGEVGAGGLVRRADGSGERIAVVHRPSYDDWVLPKGHPEAGESWEQAALREVSEETGCTARIEGLAGTLTYEKDGQAKVVVVFDMALDRDGDRTADGEVDQVAWWSPAQAGRRLTHQAERELVTRRFGLGGGRIRRRRFESLNVERLRTSLNVRVPQLRAELSRAGTGGDDEPPWVEAAHELLRRSEQALADRDIDEGWRALHTVERLRLHGADAATLADARRRLLLEANEKLRGWRLAVVQDLAGSDDTPDPARLVEAQKTLDDYFGNVYLRLQLYRDRLRWPLGLAAAALLGFLATSWRGWLPDEWSLLDSWRQVVVVVLLGMLGAMLSTSISAFRRGSKDRIPEVFGRNIEPLFRLVVGGTSAVVVVLFLETDLQTAVEVSDESMYPFAVAAGFTERLVTRMLTSLESAAGKDAGRDGGTGAGTGSGKGH